MSRGKGGGRFLSGSQGNSPRRANRLWTGGLGLGLEVKCILCTGTIERAVTTCEIYQRDKGDRGMRNGTCDVHTVEKRNALAR